MTARRRAVADLVAEGCTDKEIAIRLGISYSAARGCVRDVRMLLDAETRTEAAVKWDRLRREAVA